MLAPNMATMLAVLTTDAVVTPPVLQAALGEAVGRSFNEMTVDGCTSTNDSVIVLASGLGREVSQAALTEALTAACADLALQMVADAEGGTKVVRVRVIGAADSDSAQRAVRRVAESNLVKSSWYGEDANWGRILSELGSAGTPFDPDRASVAYGSVTVCRDGVGVDHDAEALEQGAVRPRVRDHLRSRPRDRVGVDDQRRPHAGLRRAQHGTIVSRVDLPAPVKAAVLCDALPLHPPLRRAHRRRQVRRKRPRRIKGPANRRGHSSNSPRTSSCSSRSASCRSSCTVEARRSAR